MELREYQRQAIDFIVAHPKCALWLDMGLGKTAATAHAVLELIDRVSVTRTLVVAPKRVAARTWPAEIVKWGLPLTMSVLSSRHFGLVADYSGGRRRGLKIYDPRRTSASLREMVRETDMTIVSVDMFPWLVKLLGARWPFDMVVIDESSLFKERDTVRFRAARKVCPATQRVVELTGTPATQGLMALWSQVYLLDAGERLGRTIGEYRDTWFMPGKRSPAGVVYDYVPRPGARQGIVDRISDIVLSMSSEDWLTLPQRIDNEIEIELPPDARFAYTGMEAAAIAELRGGTVVAANAAVVVGKLLQIASGSVFDDTGAVHALHDAKLDALEELIDVTPGNVFCLQWFAEDRRRILDRFPFARHLDEPGAQEAWDKGEVKMLVANPASGGHGLNLQEGGDAVVWYSLPHSLELYQQACKRIHRPGQASDRVVVNHLIARDTVEVEVLARLRLLDGEHRNLLLDALKARALKSTERA